MMRIGETDILRGETDNGCGPRSNRDRHPGVSEFPACRDPWPHGHLHRIEQDLVRARQRNCTWVARHALAHSCRRQDDRMQPGHRRRTCNPPGGRHRPPTLKGPPDQEAERPLARWLRERHAEGATLCSICGGAFLLAETGLLRDRRATTHWSYAEEFARQFPDIHIDADRLIIDDGDIVTAGGIMAWTDVGRPPGCHTPLIRRARARRPLAASGAR